jgi:carboxymethylenebutenolidase
MQERDIRVGDMRTFVVHPDGDGPFPVAVLYMDGVGYREQVKENARRFAADGYCCVAGDHFHRAGEGVTIDMAKMSADPDSDERRRMMELVGSVTPELAEADTRAMLAALHDEPAAAVAGPKVCVGYCMGARFALHAASAMSGEFVAAAGIHPGPLPTDGLAGVRGELYIAFAEIDRSVTPEVVDGFRAEMERQGVRGTVERVPGAAHGFAMADLPVYDRAASERHFERTLDLWRRNLAAEAVTS